MVRSGANIRTCNFRSSKRSITTLFAAFSACFCFECFQKTEKNRKGAFHPNSKQRGGGCGPCLLLLVHSLGKVNTAIMSISLNLYHLYLQKSHRK